MSSPRVADRPSFPRKQTRTNAPFTGFSLNRPAATRLTEPHSHSTSTRKLSANTVVPILYRYNNSNNTTAVLGTHRSIHKSADFRDCCCTGKPYRDSSDMKIQLAVIIRNNKTVGRWWGLGGLELIEFWGKFDAERQVVLIIRLMM